MKQIADLQPGDTIYDISRDRVLYYKYLCVHPTGGGNYHILIDPCQEPLRIYRDRLQTMLDKNLNSYQEAKLALAAELERQVIRLRQEPESF